jgi:four helix bundle protein
MGRTHSHEELIIWKEAMSLAKQVHVATKRYPDDERYGLTSQSRRSADSIPSNIAEGWGRNTKGEFNQFLGIALGSMAELQTLLHLGRDLDILESDLAAKLLDHCKRVRALTLKFKARMP